MVHVSEGERMERSLRNYISDEDFHLARYYGEVARARKKNASENLSLLRKLALQIITHADDKLGKQKRMVRTSLDSDYLLKFEEVK